MGVPRSYCIQSLETHHQRSQPRKEDRREKKASLHLRRKVTTVVKGLQLYVGDGERQFTEALFEEQINKKIFSVKFSIPEF